MQILLKAKEAFLSQAYQCGYIDVSEALSHAESHILQAMQMAPSFLQISEGTMSCYAMPTLNINSDLTLRSKLLFSNNAHRAISILNQHQISDDEQHHHVNHQVLLVYEKKGYQDASSFNPNMVSI